ncbi:hypothetical protein DEO72_LG5g640 [Vigna unguiculata]|uniref:Uncharacterized protein n=1 Tax=Vigna unguiculata TaxID=3917 RepID=A0A4D6LVU6_VIGUN|nr:hypothetical protein DEO72_LG5g640 [Vigna unguiculata]
MACVFFHEWRNSIETSGRQEQYSNEASFFKDATCCELLSQNECRDERGGLGEKGAPTSFLADLGIFVSAV